VQEGVARDCGGSGIMLVNLFKEDRMALDFDKLSPQELLAAESAVLTMRSLMDAVQSAPNGHGMERVESALHAKGHEHLRNMLQAAVASHEGAQKKGSAQSHVPVARTLRSSGVSPRPS
jgi:hypothetical protein